MLRLDSSRKWSRGVASVAWSFFLFGGGLINDREKNHHQKSMLQLLAYGGEASCLAEAGGGRGGGGTLQGCRFRLWRIMTSGRKISPHSLRERAGEDGLLPRKGGLGRRGGGACAACPWALRLRRGVSLFFDWKKSVRK